MEIAIIKAYDHFETEEGATECILECVGEVLKEDKIYVFLRKMSWNTDIANPEPRYRHQVEGIVKAAIIEESRYSTEEMESDVKD